MSSNQLNQLLQLVIRYTRGEKLTEEEEEILENWRKKSTQVRAELDELSQMDGAGPEEVYEKALQVLNRYRRRREVWKWMSVSAVVLLLSGLVVYWLQQDTGFVEFNNPDMAKPLVIQLPDGTKVTLNSGSSLRYPSSYNGTSRDVILSGEAAFDVAENSQSPFVVHTDSVTVGVIGTNFDIRAYPGEPEEVTVITGALHLTDERTLRIVKPTEQATIRGGEISIRRLKHPEDCLSWAAETPFLSFDSTDLYTVIQRMARYYHLKSPNAPTAGAGTITGKFPLHASVDENLRRLNEVESCKKEKALRKGDSIVIVKVFR